MKFTPQRIKFLHSIDGVNYSLDFSFRELGSRFELRAVHKHCNRRPDHDHKQDMRTARYRACSQKSELRSERALRLQIIRIRLSIGGSRSKTPFFRVSKA